MSEDDVDFSKINPKFDEIESGERMELDDYLYVLQILGDSRNGISQGAIAFNDVVGARISADENIPRCVKRMFRFPDMHGIGVLDIAISDIRAEDGVASEIHVPDIDFVSGSDEF